MLLPVHGKVLVALSEDLRLLTSPYCTCAVQLPVRGARTPGEDIVGGVSSFTRTLDFRISLPQSCPLYWWGAFSVGSAVCSPALPFLPYHLLAPDGGSVSSPRICVLGHEKKGKQGHKRAQPFLLSRPSRSAPQPSAYIALAVTWSHGYI